MSKSKKTQNAHRRSAKTYFKIFILSRHQQIWNKRKILRFLMLELIFCRKTKFLVIITLFANFKLLIFEHFSKNAIASFCTSYALVCYRQRQTAFLLFSFDSVFTAINTRLLSFCWVIKQLPCAGSWSCWVARRWPQRSRSRSLPAHKTKRMEEGFTTGRHCTTKCTQSKLKL